MNDKEHKRPADPHAKTEAEQPAPETEAQAPEGEETAAPAEAAPEAGEAPEAEASPEAQAAELKDRLLRAMAETENVRRRAERDREETAKYAVTKFARDILGVADNLRRALESAPKENTGDEVVKNLVLGVEMTEKELLAVMERHGIRPVDPMGEKFDHNLHQAMFEVPGTGQPSGTVVQVMQTGYVINDRLLRPAMVGVAKDDKPGGGNGGEDGAGEHVDTVA
jgi:molecular chaperone GrpE